ncbi:fungal-specific transcription factor domain-containing protein [Amylostereum chailletii]|nr:fungal-specific transcription factor domain-containing protein [Amylostereum chailletii]
MDPPAETGRPAQDEPTPPVQKKRRIQTAKACERCRVKKSDGTAGSDVKCSHCRTANATCVFTESPKIHPEVDTSALDDLPPHTQPSPSADPAPVARIVSHASSSSTHRDTSHRIDDDGGDDDDDDDDDDEDEDRLAPPAADPALDAHQDHLFGTSSGVQLLQRVLNLKAEGTGMHYNVYEHLSNSPYKRPDFWETHPWASPAPSPSYHFPDPDLLPVLVDNFFRVPGIIFPILHRPTFAQQLADGLHHADDAFANVLLLVCAIGAMWLDDPRVYVRGPDNVQHPHSAGWPWFNQVQLVRNTALIDPCLRDLQICALAGVFMHASCPPQTCWTLIGVGLRVMQDLGAHRRQTYVGKSPVEAELWKRAFWVLLTLDTWLSSFLGRPCALSIENVDVDLPTDCDDEYWAHPDPTRTLKQPPGMPSMISFPIAWFRLHVIHAHALQTIVSRDLDPFPRRTAEPALSQYSTDKQRIIAQIGRPEWERRTVAELDAALNKWFDSIPDHLRWNPTCANDVHFFGAVSLLSGYYLVQMTIHRSFIRSSHKKSALSFQSLTLCVNAARACRHVLEVALLRQPGPTPSLLIPAFMSGIVLLLGMWTAKRTGIAFDMERETHNVRNCVKFIRTGEHRWPTARRLMYAPFLSPSHAPAADPRTPASNLLRNLSAAGDLPATESPMPTATASTRKRARSPDPQTSNPSFLAPALASTEDWDTYVSNLVDIGTEADGASGRAGAFGV